VYIMFSYSNNNKTCTKHKKHPKTQKQKQNKDHNKLENVNKKRIKT